jgi:hypothetical protein
MEVDAELSVRELRGKLVGKVHGKSGLAHTPHAEDGGDHHRSSAVNSTFRDDGVEAGQLHLAPRERTNVAGELTQRRRTGLEGVGSAVETILSIQLEVGLLTDCHERSGRHVQRDLIRLDDVQRRQTVTPFIFHEGAVGAVELSCQSSERDTPPFTGLPEGEAQARLRQWLTANQVLTTGHRLLPTRATMNCDARGPSIATN